MSWAEHGYGANLRLADFATDRTALATHHQGETLTAEHGFPLHLVVPHLYGHKGPKSLRGIKYLTEDGRRLLGRTWLPQHRRPLSRTALLLPGATSRRVTPVTVAAPRATRTARCLRRVPPATSGRPLRPRATGIASCRVQDQQPQDRTGTDADDLLTCTPAKWL